MKKPILVIVSGHFSPLRKGHIDLFKGAQALGDKLLVIVNNDEQQKLKKAKVMMDEEERLEIIRAIRYIDEVQLAIDRDPTINKTLDQIAQTYPDHQLIFANGGARRSIAHISEITTCQAHNIQLAFDVGG